MTRSDSKSDPLPDRIRLDRIYDVDLLRKDVVTITSSLQPQTYVYYSPVPLATNIKSPSSHNWAEEPMLEGCSYLKKLFQDFETEITSIRLMRLQAWAEIKEHSDPTLDAELREIIRLTLPIISDEHVKFFLNKVEVPMQPGELWYMNLSELHSVHNGPNERINMSIDVVWNDWVGNWLSANVE